MSCRNTSKFFFLLGLIFALADTQNTFAKIQPAPTPGTLAVSKMDEVINLEMYVARGNEKKPISEVPRLLSSQDK